ncbi:hypothetical protein [Devosia nitrariae]|uniref:DUF982 domain-containing protein n=1 Tax=Devosia nitrariae TaxID=2071872 RepID=A0ABQ5W2Q0_9HYPH|nr:hypothetical protein [Devosia nitrariae]GLQ54282.1 hypothetical protein GCM10010862_15410 [Devosia nitrariae]
MPERPDLEELEATVKRMEARWQGAPQFPTYRALCRRFEADLADPRDLALAKSAALMLVKFLNEDS